MAIKRYLPKYKKLARFRHPIWFEKRIKIRKFEKQKWERVKKLYYPRKVRCFRQDVSSYSLTRRYNIDRFIRRKRTYKYLLRDKQRLQLYYGVGKFRFFQSKNEAKKIRSRMLTRKLTSAKAMLSLFENRLDIVIYRLSIVSSIPQSRKLIQDGRVKIGSMIIKNSNYNLKPNDVISFDPFIKDRIFGLFLRNFMPYFFYRYKENRREYIKERKEIWKKMFLKNKALSSLLRMKSLFLKLKTKKTNDTIKN